MPVFKSKTKTARPAAMIVLSFAIVIAIGSFLLMLPVSSKSGSFTEPVTAVFTAASATCVTGLSVVDTGTYWSVFGQVVIILMVQIGGLGFVTLVSFFNFLMHKKMELHSIQVASESVNTSGFYDVKLLIKYVISVSFICEFAGSLLLMTSLVPKYGAYGVYISVFLSISAFCNSGFDVLGAVETPNCSLMPLASDPVVMTVISLLIIAGGLGFVVWTDIISYRQKKRLSLQSKIVLIFTLILTVIGMTLTLVTEWTNPDTIGNMSAGGKFATSLFYSIALRSAGFSTVDSTSLRSITKLFSIFIMFIGAAPCSTGGGIKITTFAIVIMTVVSVIKNKNDTIIMGRKIDKESVYKSLSIIVLAALVMCVTSTVLFYSTDGAAGIDAAFETISALATTGMSVGVSAVSGVFSRILLCVTMFIGRVGPVSFAISISAKSENKNKNEVYPEGKLMVG